MTSLECMTYIADRKV